METQEAGACGVLGIICQVNGKGTPLLSSFASAIGLDAPVEVVNIAELEFLLGQNVPTFAFGCSVGLSLPIPGFAADMNKAMLAALPRGVPAIIGVKSIEEARTAALNGAACLLLRSEWIATAPTEPRALQQFIADVQYAVSFDD